MITRERAKELLPIIQAYAEGREIQYRGSYKGEWKDVREGDCMYFNLEPSCYRIKSQPKYRPFNNYEECWNEMFKHKPFGWVSDKTTRFYYPVEKVSNYNDYKGIFEEYEFADGTPFGIKED